MNHFEDINRHPYLLLRSIAEPEENVLHLEVAEAMASGPAEDITISGVVLTGTQPLETIAGCYLYTIMFETYIAYAITNESYAQDAAEDRYEGKRARIYTESAFLAFLRSSTCASSEYPGPFKHYALCCLNHIIDVASCEPPKIVCEIAS